MTALGSISRAQSMRNFPNGVPGCARSCGSLSGGPAWATTHVDQAGISGQSMVDGNVIRIRQAGFYLAGTSLNLSNGSTAGLYWTNQAGSSQVRLAYATGANSHFCGIMGMRYCNVGDYFHVSLSGSISSGYFAVAGLGGNTGSEVAAFGTLPAEGHVVPATNRGARASSGGAGGYIPLSTKSFESVEAGDTPMWASADNTKYTVRETGFYVICANGTWGSGHMYIYVGGNAVAYISPNWGAARGLNVLRYCTVGEEVRLYSSGSLGSGYGSQLSIGKVG